MFFARTVPSFRRALAVPAASLIALLLAMALAPSPAAAYNPAGRTPAGDSSPSGGASPSADPAVWGRTDLIRQASQGTFAAVPPSGPALIHLGAGYTLDPAAGGTDESLPADLRVAPPQGAESGTFLVQFRGPVGPDDRRLLEQAGGKIWNYVPGYSFLVSLTGNARDQVAASSRVSWVGLYQPAYKISREKEMVEPGPHEMLVLLFPDAPVDEAGTAITAAGGSVLQVSDNGINRILKINLDTANLAAVARLPQVAWIEPFHIQQLYNNQAQWVVQTWQNNNRHLWDMGLKGQNQIISLCDSGIRTTHYQFYDSAHLITNFGDYPTHRKIIAYKKSTESTSITFGDDAGNGYHGTHTSCTAGGDDSPNATDNRDGMAINSRIYFLDGGGTAQTGIFIPLDLNDLMILPYNGNTAGAARIMTNSWGSSTGGVYDIECMTVDQFMWNHPDFLPFFSNGNDGLPNSVGSPASAKNCVSAGGTENGTGANIIYSSTSRGPTDDGRIKPTICSPATLSSAYGASNSSYVTYSGTSMASPSMAGATVLLRQYLTEGWYPTGAAVPGNAVPDPSAALLKAMAVNSADPDVSGYTVPDNNIGWGRIDDENVAYFNGDARRLALIDNPGGVLTGEYIEYQVYVASNTLPLKATLVWTDYPGNPSASVQLVNDLNLIASDGVNTYKGNVYSGGQSVTGGTADARNVEECVRRNSPTVGLWTFRIEGLNVPYGPQPFALVVTGALGSDAAVVSLDRATYGGTDNTGIRVVDTNAGSSITVTMTSQTEPAGESVTLNGSNGVYAGSFPLSLSYPATGDGRLSVSDGDQITLTYLDANPAATLTATARVDISGPAISDVHATSIDETDLTLAWNTTAPSNSRIYYGTSPSLGQQSDLDATLVSAHSLVLSGLTPSTLYYYDVESFDNQGNGVRDDNGGAHYTVSTDQNRDVLLVIGDGTFTRKNYYQNAFARSGWTYTIWENAAAATPYVGNLVSGMASYKAVVWQTGFEQYPMFADAARDSIAKLDLLGSRLAVFSHDVAWDFSDGTSPDYSAARKAWFENELKATWQNDPTTFSQARGYTGDPISGAYTAGIAYTPIRDGGAGDEVNGISTGGSFANVWRDNLSPGDDIAIRWTSSANVGDPLQAVWGGTPRKVSSNFFEWAQLNPTNSDDVTRSDVLDKTLIWLVGHDHPTVAVTAPNGGESFTGSSVSIAWTEAVDTGYSVASRKIYYSDNGGDRWNLITASAGASPYSWDISTIPNGAQYRVKVVLSDNASPALSASDQSNANFTLNRAGGDNRGPVVLAGSIASDPNPIQVPDPATLTATVSDVYTGNTNIQAAEWSEGANPAPAGSGNPMAGLFNAPLVTVSATLDSNLLPPGTATLWVRGQDAAGNWGGASRLDILVNSSTAAPDAAIPLSFALYGNSPNPSRTGTEIRFAVPRPAHVALAIFDVSGRRVRTLVDGPMTPGVKSLAWDGRDLEGEAVGSGIYFYKLVAGDFEAVKKLTLVR